ncbi:hypothetical protein V6N13_008654 [Hibiscus sabdariffa]
MSDSLVRVSRRAGWGARRPTPGARWYRSTPRRRVLGSTIEATTSPRAYQRPGLGPPPRSASAHAPSQPADRLSPFHIRPGRIAGPHPLSKSFSSFPRGTCSLSVSRPYLALDGIYRPIRAAFPNNPTRRQRLVVRQGPGTTGLSPSPAPLSRGLGLSPPLRALLQTTIRTPRATDSQAGLFPVRSPLLRESFGHVSAAQAPRTGVQQQTAIFSFRFLGVIHAGGCSFCHGDTGSRVTGTRRGRGAMKRPHPLPLMFDNTFTGRSARFSGLLATSRAANRPRRRDPNTSPDHSIGRSDGRIGSFARLLPSLDVVAVSQAPSPESNPNSPSPVTTIVGHYPTIEN